MKLRLLAAASVVVSAGIHLKLWHDGYKFIPTVGHLFLLNVAGGIVIALMLMAWRHWVPAVLAMCFGMATLGAFTTATTIGLFGSHEVWQGRFVFGAAGVELVAIIAGAALVLTYDETPSESEAMLRAQRSRGKHVASL